MMDVLPVLVKIGFLPISLWDLLDVAIVSYLLFQLYKLVRGSVASNIFIGVVLLYALWFLVGILGMTMLRALLGQFVSVGVIIIIIIFQPEIRRFLILLGNNTLRRRGQVLRRLFGFGESPRVLSEQRKRVLRALSGSILEMSKQRTGALIVVTDNADNEPLGMSGTLVNAEVSRPLLLTIFDKHTPLHDGALIIQGNTIIRAGCVLPVTESSDLPQSLGLRHRAAVGLTELSKATCFVVSEETGSISVARDGKLLRRLSESKLEQELNDAYGFAPVAGTPAPV